MIKEVCFAIRLRSGAERSSILKLGSPNWTVAPPTIAIGENPNFARRAKFKMEIKFPKCSECAVGSKPQ